jgi:hypothetical protein
MESLELRVRRDAEDQAARLERDDGVADLAADEERRVARVGHRERRFFGSSSAKKAETNRPFSRSRSRTRLTGHRISRGDEVINAIARIIARASTMRSAPARPLPDASRRRGPFFPLHGMKVVEVAPDLARGLIVDREVESGHLGLRRAAGGSGSCSR